jgi:hypothetical protein
MTELTPETPNGDDSTKSPDEPWENESPWPGRIEYISIYFGAPLSVVVVIAVALRNLFPTQAEIATLCVATVGVALVCLVAASRFNSEYELRRRHWNGLVHSAWSRWLAFGLIALPMVGAAVFLRQAPPPVAELEAGEKNETAVQREKQILEKTPNRTNEEKDVYALQDMKLHASHPTSNIHIFVSTPNPANPNNSTPIGPVFIHYPPEVAEDQQRREFRTQIVQKHGNKLGPEFAFLALLPVPALPVALMLRWGGSEEYKNVTLEAVSQAANDGEVDGKTRTSLIKQLQANAKSPNQIDDWAAAAKLVIDQIQDDSVDETKAKAEIEKIAAEAKRPFEELEQDATNIVLAIKTTLDMKLRSDKDAMLDSKAVADIVTPINQNPSPTLKQRVRDLLQGNPEDKKYLDAWDAYLHDTNAPSEKPVG